MSAPERAALFSETACDTNNAKSEKQRKAGCPKPQPGGTAGGCTFDGAMITLVPIADSAHVVHGPIACAGNSWDGRGSLSSGPTLYRHGFTTDMSENDVVLGGEQRLFDTVCEIVERYAPPAVFVYSTCVTAMIGDDLDAVCASASAQTGVPVIPVEAPGFVGNKNLGNKIAGQALLDHVIGTVEPDDAGPLDVNLIGEYNIAGELWDVLPVLRRLGLRVRACISGDARYRDVAAAHRARATMVVCSRALLGLARGLEERYGIPWFEGSFYGTRAMADSLRGFARLLDDDDLTRRTEELIAAEEAATEAAIAPYRARLAGRKAVLYTGGVKSWSIVSALQELGIEVVGSGITKSSDGDVDRIRELLGDSKMIKDSSPRELLRVAEDTGADILVAGGRNQYTALKGRLPFLDINQERHIPYAGYTGMVEFARQLDMAIASPVWEQVRRPAPWDAADAGARDGHAAEAA
ncbi:Nitrogenase iron-molybdenum cofactor biosynthesis protein NifE [Frankia canadensis]|uniref:Nitrogenase iron-molybdenum cofactor biosynthesis protein NifE n=1 Tax=Frankia canadensis TaxID=1836972 RepID=A0A2I2KYP6_9ACTN|nr:nitrogenase iron-molybdenum cofactor biosynthesis protein NifE [Frankia canadensis]SNQ50778.1 Nitrogenase iron-molybdenum cofactor biosynthesis protein NifE [Frankia canadensis]SOU58068.1 Nitrogenase iron-molybdenum cofactor biosynthesis protein NifE [Frankia canadensis]